MPIFMRRYLIALAVSLCFAGTASQAQASQVKIFNTPGGHFVRPGELIPADLDNGRLVTRAVLPDNYSSRKCWPVIYLLHGTGYGADPAPTEWINRGGIADRNVPAIVVIPGGGPTWWVDQWSNTARRPQWESWFLREVMPLMSKKLHICGGRKQHSIAGLSMGGYGALYLASQRPDYFGTAASFSGVIAPRRPEWGAVYDRFQQLYGPPNGFYAIGKDPVSLVENLRSTRVLLESGDGTPLGNESVSASQRFQEQEFQAQTKTFFSAAKRAGLKVTLEQHKGAHTWENWRFDLERYLQWGPWSKVPKPPSSWRFTTVDQIGTAWGYRFRFSGFPGTVEQFSKKGKTFRAVGSGRATIVHGHMRRTANLPFEIVKGKVRRLSRKTKVKLPSGAGSLVPLSVSPKHAAGTTPIKVSFKSRATLNASQEYGVGLVSIGGNCSQTVTARIPSARKGQRVSATLVPPSGGWCPGAAVVGVLRQPRGSTQFSVSGLIGYAKLTLR
jgi:S-formylglutathione hydrolase FrmB